LRGDGGHSRSRGTLLPRRRRLERIPIVLRDCLAVEAEERLSELAMDGSRNAGGRKVKPGCGKSGTWDAEQRKLDSSRDKKRMRKGG